MVGIMYFLNSLGMKRLSEMYEWGSENWYCNHVSSEAQFRCRSFHEPNQIPPMKYTKSLVSESTKNGYLNSERLSHSFRLAQPFFSPWERLRFKRLTFHESNRMDIVQAQNFLTLFFIYFSIMQLRTAESSSSESTVLQRQTKVELYSNKFGSWKDRYLNWAAVYEEPSCRVPEQTCDIGPETRSVIHWQTFN